MLSDVTKNAISKYREGIESQIKQLSREKASLESELQRVNGALNYLTNTKDTIDIDVPELKDISSETK
jgi:prefoldin subunit 5